MRSAGNSFSSFFGKDIYILYSAVLSVPVWMALNAYVRAIHVAEEEFVTTVASVLFIAGVFWGRNLALLWGPKIRIAHNDLIKGLSVAIVVCVAWLFIHADFQVTRSHEAISILLYWLPFIFISVATGFLVKIYRSVVQNQLREARTTAANSHIELQLLQSQMSPHFLFNTLNNLYGISITRHQEVPGLLLKLSELLRYSVYEAKEMYVPLKDELTYLRNYIDFEKLRIGDRLHLDLDFDERSNGKIAPMLLIVFIENAFKHSKNTHDEKIFVNISLKLWEGQVFFSVKNSYSELKNHESTDKNSGLGLANVRKRLELLYPGEHELKLKESEGTFSVTLRLKIK